MTKTGCYCRVGCCSSGSFNRTEQCFLIRRRAKEGLVLLAPCLTASKRPDGSALNVTDRRTVIFFKSGFLSLNVTFGLLSR